MIDIYDHHVNGPHCMTCGFGHKPSECPSTENCRQCHPNRMPLKDVSPNYEHGYIVKPSKEYAGHTQTILASPENERMGIYGNCLQACVATYFELSMDAVPHFAAFENGWEEALRLWLRGTERGLYRMDFAEPIGVGRCLLIGPSPRGVKHVCVGEDGRVIWDPHPDRSGLLKVTAAIVFEDDEVYEELLGDGPDGGRVI